MEPRKNAREVKRKKFFAKPKGKLMHHFWQDGRMMMCTEHLKVEKLVAQTKKVIRMDERALADHHYQLTRQDCPVQTKLD